VTDAERYELVLLAVEPSADRRSVEELLVSRFALAPERAVALLGELPATLCRDLDQASAEQVLHGLRELGLRVRLTPQQTAVRRAAASSSPRQPPAAPPASAEASRAAALAPAVPAEVEVDDEPPSFFRSIHWALRAPFGAGLFPWFLRFVLTQGLLFFCAVGLALMLRGIPPPFGFLFAFPTFIALAFTVGAYTVGTWLAWLRANMRAACLGATIEPPGEAESVAHVMPPGRAVGLSMLVQGAGAGVLYVYAVRAALDRSATVVVVLTLVFGGALTIHNFVVTHQVAAGASALRLLDIGAAFRSLVAAPLELLLTLVAAAALALVVALVEQVTLVVWAGVVAGTVGASAGLGLAGGASLGAGTTGVILGGGLLLTLLYTTLSVICSGIVAGLVGLAFRAKPDAAG
jgi:hypothetical protein